MIPGNTGNNKKYTETTIHSGLKIVEAEIRVERPDYVDVEVEKPVYVDKEISVPVGFEEVANKIAEDLYEKIMIKVLGAMDKQLIAAIDKRLTEIEAPKIVYKEELNVIKKDVEVANAVVKDVQVTNAIVTDVPVKNAVVEDYKVINAVVTDVNIKNAIVEDVEVSNAVVVEVPVVHSNIKTRTVEAVNIKWLKPNGEADEC
jgi:hypothetical protein